MNAVQTLIAANELGVSVTLTEDGDLLARPKEKLTPELIEALRENKAEIVGGRDEQQPQTVRKKSPALPPEELSWERLVQEGPRLGELAHDIDLLRERDKPLGEDGDVTHFCVNHHWHGGLKQRMSKLVGWDAYNPKLWSEAAYSLAYDNLYERLPDCRRCWCTGPLYPPHPEALSPDELSWERMVEDDRLKTLKDEVRSEEGEYIYETLPAIRENVVAYRVPDKVRSDLWDFRGWISVAIEDICRTNPKLRSFAAFDVAMDELYGKLEDAIVEELGVDVRIVDAY